MMIMFLSFMTLSDIVSKFMITNVFYFSENVASYFSVGFGPEHFRLLLCPTGSTGDSLLLQIFRGDV